MLKPARPSCQCSGDCGNVCHSNTQPVDGGLVFTQQCTGGTCKCTDSAQCPGDTPICNTDTGVCGLCSFKGDQGLPCAVRANTLKSEWAPLPVGLLQGCSRMQQDEVGSWRACPAAVPG